MKDPNIPHRMAPCDFELDGTNSYVCFDLGNNEFGIFDPSGHNRIVDIYYNHNFNGSGASNSKVSVFETVLDLEFCRSRELTIAEDIAVHCNQDHI